MSIPASAQKPVAADPDNAGLGIVLMMGAVAAIAVIDTCAKVLVQDMQPFMVVFARYTLALVYVIAVMWWTGALSLDTRHPWLQVLRGDDDRESQQRDRADGEPRPALGLLLIDGDDRRVRQGASVLCVTGGDPIPWFSVVIGRIRRK